MKVFKKFLAVLCSATLIVSASVTAFAADDTPASSATGNVIAYNFDTVTVPTTIKIAFNPQGLPIKIGGTAEAPVTTTDKIVSLNYGIANKASTDKKVVVKFAANAAVVDGKTKDLTFVDADTKAQAKSESNATGAEAGDHKIYLRVAPATAQPTINDGENDGAGSAFAVTTAEDGSKTENASAANLANVKMTAAAAAKSVAFATGTNNDAFANIGFALDKSTYSLKSGESIDFDTTQSEVASKLELSAFGTKSITGFTFAGEMNDNTVWTEANITSISITPTYEFTEKGTEAAVDDTFGMVTLTKEADVAEPAAPTPSEEQQAETAAAGFKTTYATVLALDAESVTGSEEELAAIEAAIAAFDELSEAAQTILATDEITAESLAAIKELSEAAGAPTTYTMIINTNNGNLVYAFTSDAPTGTLTAVSVNGTDRAGQVSNGNIAYSNGVFRINASVLSALGITQGNTTIVATIGGAEYTFVY